MIRSVCFLASLGVSLSFVLPQRSATSILKAAVVSEPPPLSPETIWGNKFTDITEIHKEANKSKLPAFSVEISGKNIDNEVEYFRENREKIVRQLQDHGAVIFRDFDLMKTQEGFEQFYQTIQFKPCLDPLHSVSARPTVNGDKNSPVYEAVNKESRKNFFIGMHNEFVGTRSPRAAAFCCFQPAATGGEFLIADGRQIFRDLPQDLVERLYNKEIRYSVMELPFFSWIDGLPEFLQNPVSNVVQSVVTAGINAKVDFEVEMLWGTSDYDNARILQARAPSQPPILRHPITGDPTWFCNVHSHSSKLRKLREEVYGAERFEDGASRINKSDMFYGDDSELNADDLETLDRVTKQNMKYVKMQQGDVVLLDNYKTLHGRNVFDGKRKHGVCWFEGWEGEELLA